MTAKPVYVFDGVSHELIKIVEDRGEYLAYRLKEVWVTASGKAFTFEEEPHASWGYKPYEDADVSTDPAVYFHDVKRWSVHKVRM
jgi:hypothetical protein